MTYYIGFYAMGTRLNAVFPASYNDTGHDTLTLIKNEVTRIEAMLRWVNFDNEPTRVNKCADKDEVKLNPELYEVLNICQDHSAITKGSFNIYQFNW